MSGIDKNTGNIMKLKDNVETLLNVINEIEKDDDSRKIKLLEKIISYIIEAIMENNTNFLDVYKLGENNQKEFEIFTKIGYFGNPKSNETMDASQSPSFVGYFKNSDVYKNILDAGFEVRGVTIYESYNYTYQMANPKPREYLIHPVDEKFDVFEPYTDALYDKFIAKAKEVFKKYNEEKQCNPDNLELLFDPNNKMDCYNFTDDEHAHGGYECNVTTGNWSNVCKPYYCDIGYYFDKHTEKCVKDICTEGKDDREKSEGRIITWNKFTMIIALLALLL